MAEIGDYGLAFSYPSFRDLTDYRWRFVRMRVEDGHIDVASNANGSPSDIVGVLESKPRAYGVAATIVTHGELPVIAAGAITWGDPLTTTQSGYATVATSGQLVAAIATSRCWAAGEQVRALLRIPAFRLTF